MNALKLENSMRSFVSLLAFLAFCAWASPVHAWMWEVGDEELSEVTGEGFSSFTLQDGVAKAYFNIEAATYTQIESLKMGYYTKGTSTGWDQDWTNVSFGAPATDLVCKGLYLEASFTNLSDPANRQLNYVKFGTPDMTGPVSANFASFSGRIVDSGNNVLVNGSRVNLGTRTINSNHSAFSVTLDRTAGWWVDWNNATITP